VRKIPTLFERDPENRKYVLPIVTPGCEWVMAGEGVATRKYDGTCVLIRRDGMAVQGYARREVKPGKEPPVNWVEADADAVTGKRVGWEPIDQSGFARWFHEAVTGDEMPGTYELCGPKINGNPEGFDRHVLVGHEGADRYPAMNAPQSFEELQAALTALVWEGIVWHHPDGRMAKLKRRDFPAPSTERET
jgi:hypothetical protein